MEISWPIVIAFMGLLISIGSIIFNSGWNLNKNIDQTRKDIDTRREQDMAVVQKALENVRLQIVEHEKWVLQYFVKHNEFSSVVHNLNETIGAALARIERRIDETRTAIKEAEERSDKRVARIEETLDEHFHQ